MHTPEEINAIRALAAGYASSTKGRPLVLSDADHTLAPKDGSKMFFLAGGLNEEDMCRNFDQNGYTKASLLRHRDLHLAVGRHFEEIAERAAKLIDLSDDVVAFFRAASKLCTTIVLTGGVPLVWSHVLRNHGLTDVSIHGTVRPEGYEIFEANGKGIFARELAPHSAWSLAIGDSQVETQMMKASTVAAMVARRCKKTGLLNPELSCEIAGHPNIIQVTHKPDVKHEGIKLVAWRNLLDESAELAANRQT